MDWTIGNIPRLETLKPELVLTFYPQSFPLRWGLCSTTADFCADYLATREPCQTSRDAINYVLNELVENAVKFSEGDTIQILLAREGDELLIVVDNFVTAPNIPPLQDTLRELLSDDPIELMMRRVEENAEHPESEGSGLGFLTMMTDYATRLGWRIFGDPKSEAPACLRTMARLDITRG